ncbi:hypothetical protein Hdeb2414_s0033g00724961 [Helianthus debilis subsp. tardiflorus]
MCRQLLWSPLLASDQIACHKPLPIDAAVQVTTTAHHYNVTMCCHEAKIAAGLNRDYEQVCNQPFIRLFWS